MTDNYTLQCLNDDNPAWYFDHSESSPRLTYVFLIFFHLNLFRPKGLSHIYVLFPMFAKLTTHHYSSLYYCSYTQ